MFRIRPVVLAICAVGFLFFPADAADPGEECATPEVCFEQHLFEQILHRFPHSIWASRARAVVGARLLKNGDANGRPLLRQAIVELPIVGDHLQWLLAESLFREGDFHRAALAYRAIHTGYPESLFALRARYFEGRSWYQQEDCQRAHVPLREFLQNVTERSVSQELRPLALAHMADCDARSGRREEALGTLWRVWAEFPHLLQGEVAVALEPQLNAFEVNEERASADHLKRRVARLLEHSQYSRVIEILSRYRDLPAARDRAARDEAMLQLGIAYVRTRQFQQAKTVFEELVRERSTIGPREAYVWLARTYLRMSDGTHLMHLGHDVQSLDMPPAIRGKIFLMVGVWLEDEEQYAEAQTAYERAISDAADGSDRLLLDDVRWRLAWMQFRNGNLKDSIQVFDLLQTEQTDGRMARKAGYWKARALIMMGKEDEGRSLFRRLCEGASQSYYCQNARLHSDVSVVSGRSLPEPRRTPPSQPLLEKARELNILGFVLQAADELDAFAARTSHDPTLLLPVIQLMSQVGAAHRALDLVKRHFSEFLDAGGQDDVSWFWDLAYPSAYESSLGEALAPHQKTLLDPYLIAAVIREESAYDPSVVSKAGALGLMQLLPQTGEMIAGQVQAEAFHPDQLLDPKRNIRFGVWYLQSLSERFEGNLVHAVAAYNAGPSAVSRWVKQIEQWSGNVDRRRRNSDIEIFIEAIGFQETREYVKRIVRSYREYHRVNQTGCRVAFLDKTC